MKGDFVDIFERVDSSDLVVMDKVICCYSDFKKLVSYSIPKARVWYAYSIPRDIWWVKLGHRFEEWKKRRAGDLFPTFIHPTNEIEQLIKNHGMRKVKQFHKGQWLYVLFEK